MAINSNYADNIRNFGEGKLNPNTASNSTTPPSTFVRMIVKEVLSDPNNELKDETKKARWQGMGVTNMNYVDKLPRNTIVAKRVGEDVDPMFVFPFFPSHLSMPCKPGECVWVMFEKPDAPNSDMAFWFSRIVEPHVSDDINHSHPGRSFETSLYSSTKDRHENAKSGPNDSGEHVWHELRNGPVVIVGEDKDRVTSRESVILKGEEEDIFESLIMSSEASKLMSYEAVPRFRKRPGDVVLEGSNNTLVVLGTERSGSLEKSKFSEAGSVDIVVGRGQTKTTLGEEASTTWMKDAKGHIKGTELKKELNKSLDVVVPNEGDPDLKNDRSRILISQKTSVDQNFSLKDYNEQKGLTDTPKGDAAIVVKTDKIRLIARSDIEILVTGFTEGSTPNGQTKKDESSDTKKWASIIIKSNGDIVLTPADEGLLKLGGDDANLAVLCSPSIPVKLGEVTAPPISTTMGGQVGVAGSAALGVWASKILVK